MTVQWHTYAGVLRWRVVMAAMVASPPNGSEYDVAKDRASVVSAARTEGMARRVTPHVSG